MPHSLEILSYSELIENTIPAQIIVFLFLLHHLLIDLFLHKPQETFKREQSTDFIVYMHISLTLKVASILIMVVGSMQCSLMLWLLIKMF